MGRWGNGCRNGLGLGNRLGGQSGRLWSGLLGRLGWDRSSGWAGMSVGLWLSVLCGWSIIRPKPARICDGKRCGRRGADDRVLEWKLIRQWVV